MHSHARFPHTSFPSAVSSFPAPQVHALMGHGCGAAAGGGMSSKQQQAALEAFRQPGCQLLVSTAAGEEGIDVPRCELVVRYAATQTGETGWKEVAGGC